MDINRLTVDAYDIVLKSTFLLMLFPAATVFVFGKLASEDSLDVRRDGGGASSHTLAWS